MTNPAGTTSALRPLRASAAACEAAAAEWVMRRDAGLDAVGEQVFAEWLAADPAHAEAYARLAGTWAVFDRAAQKGATTTIVTHLEIRARCRRARRRVATGAGATVAAALLFAFWPWRSPMISTTPVAQTAPAFEPIRKLPDGSIVELNDGAAIAVQYAPDARRVRLVRGEALFRVEKDAARPFLVQADGVEVRAVGTAFNVRLAEWAVEVLVTEGRVAVDQTVGAVVPNRPPSRAVEGNGPYHSAPAATLLSAGERAVVSLVPEAPTPEVVTVSPAEIEARLAWRIPRLEFAGMELARAVALMNRHNRLQIVLGNPALGRLRVSGVFRSDNPEGFVRIVEQTFDLRAEYQGEHEVVLNGPNSK